MKSSKAKELLEKSLLGGVVPFLIGGTGVGKSAVVRKLAEKLADNKKLVENVIDPNSKQFGFIDFRLSLYESVDLGGLPYIDDSNQQKRAFLGNLPIGGQGILFFDEYAQAHPSVQAIVSQLIDERKLGEYILPEGWRLICASNRASDRAGSHKLPTHVVSRISLINFDVDFEDWFSWANANEVNTKILGYLQFQPNALQQFDASIVEAQPCPRQWVNLSKILNATPDLLNSSDTLQSLTETLVGEKQAIEFNNFLVLLNDVPNLSDIVTGAEVEVVDDVGLCYATSVALLDVIANASEADVVDYFENALNYIKQFPTPEFAIFFVRQVAERRKEITNSSVYGQFKIDHKDLEYL
jgi:hypothetical protein